MCESTELSRDKEKFDFDASTDEKSVIELHSKSFALASKLLPKAVRHDVCKLYAWCRWCDNAVDEAPSHAIAKVRLGVLRNDIEAIYSGKEPLLAASKWYADLFARYDLPQHLPLDLLLGMESDLDFEAIKDDSDLELYCYRVAGVVGLMMCRLLGVSDTSAYENANRLGIAMQLTNIARDIAEDWDRGRCYLPQTWVEFNPETDPRPSDSQVGPHVKRLLQLAESNYQLGYRGYPALPTGTRLAIRVAAAVYRGIGIEIKTAEFKVMNVRRYVSTLKKIGLVGQQLTLEITGQVTATFLCLFSRRTWNRNAGSVQSNTLSFGDFNMNSQFHYLAVFGLSMTLIMATVLFALVGLNPKFESYDSTPWIYSVLCASTAGGLWFWAQSIGRKLDALERQSSS